MQTPTTLADMVWYWYDTMGLNLVPADSKIKLPITTWKEWQDVPQPREVIQNWLKTGAFNQGLAIMAGRIYRGLYAGKYLIFIDCDSKGAIDAACSIFRATLSQMAERTIVEQHLDNLEKCHIYFVSDTAIPKKGSNTLGLEIKSEAKHGIAYASPSIHKMGHRYQIVGTNEPLVLNEKAAMELQDRFTAIFANHGIEYSVVPPEYFGIIDEPEYTKTLSPQKIDKIVRTLTPKFTKGNRHKVVFSLSGYLRKKGVPQSVTEGIVTRLCESTGSNWTRNHLVTVRQAYRRDITLPIAGARMLMEALA